MTHRALRDALDLRDPSLDPQPDREGAACAQARELKPAAVVNALGVADGCRCENGPRPACPILSERFGTNNRFKTVESMDLKW